MKIRNFLINFLNLKLHPKIHKLIQKNLKIFNLNHKLFQLMNKKINKRNKLKINLLLNK